MNSFTPKTNIRSSKLNENFSGVANGTEIADNVIDSDKVKTEWTLATLQNSWANYGSDHPPASYLKTPDGTVHLRGLVRFGSSITAVIFTLPAGYRPDKNVLNTVCNATHASGTSARIDVYPDGTVFQDATNGSTGWVSLSGISFKAEQ